MTFTVGVAQDLGLPHATAADPLRDLAAAAGYLVDSAGQLPRLRHIVAVRPQRPDRAGGNLTGSARLDDS
jgi:hypothetical protein